MLTSTTLEGVPVAGASATCDVPPPSVHGAGKTAVVTSELYRAHAAAIFARCRRILHDRAAAEDAAQETFIRVLRHSKNAPPAPDLRQWLLRIAINVCLNVLRDSRVRAKAVADVAHLPGSVTPEQALIERDLIRRVIAHAPNELRAAAWLHHVEGLRQVGVAQALGVSRRTVVNRLSAFSHYLRYVGSPRFRAIDV